MNNIIKEIIIVEGKTDTQKLQSIYGENIKTIETHGLSLKTETVNLIRELNNKQGVIIFTDPDGPGKKIREILNYELNGEVRNAFIFKSDINQKSKKIGIAEADINAIKNALKNLITFNKENESITWSEYLENDFYTKENRVKIANKFSFDNKLSSKSLFKWLNWMNLNVEKIKELLEEKE